MKGEQGSHTSTPPLGRGRALQKQKQQDAVGGVKQRVGEVMSSRVQPIDLHIDHVREPGERMPITGVGALKRPAQPGYAQTFLNDGILTDILRVIIIYEGVMEHWLVKSQGQETYRQGY